jgi:hypothetical protein
MKTPVALLLASCLVPAAHADDAPVHYGAPDCQVGKLLPVPNDHSVHWTGPCKDGYADGKGVLEWTTKDGTTRRIEGTFAHGAVSGEAKLKAGDKFTYIGSLTDGVPDGEGYLHFASDLRYEGGLKMMRREGKGVQIYPNGDTYEGEFHADRPNGQGRLTYALGGMVEGEFRDGRPLDGDRITYAGSGRVGTLDAAARNAALARPKAENTFQQRQAEPDTGTLLAKTDVRSALPTNVGWDGLTPEQKDIVRNRYPALEPGDEPPYPVNGVVEFNRLILTAAGKFDARGLLRLNVLVGTDGKAKEVRRVGQFDDDVVRYVAAAAMALRYKPAVCHGQPCEMLYPISMEITRRL